MNESEPSSVDKEKLYEENLRRTRWMDKLFKRASHKALDIPEEDMQINNSGINGRHLVALAGIVLAGALGWRGLSPDVALPAAAPAAASQEYEVRFWAEDGKEIDVLPFRSVEGEGS